MKRHHTESRGVRGSEQHKILTATETAPPETISITDFKSALTTSTAPVTPGLILSLQHLIGNQAVIQLLDRSAPEQLVQRAPAKPPLLTWAKFVRILKTKYGVADVRVGTQQEQTKIFLTERPVAKAALLPNPANKPILPDWHSWNPGSTPQNLSHIIKGLDTFMTLGGLPALKTILFFDKAYDYDAGTRTVKKKDTVAAAYGAGNLTIYSYTAKANRGLPVRRGTPGGNIRIPGTAVSVPRNIPSGDAEEAATTAPSREESIVRIVTHEVAHGLYESIMKTYPAHVPAYNKVAGWRGNKLYDVQAVNSPAVKRLLARDPKRLANYQITKMNWYKPKWKEQPMSDYMADSPREDFAEAIMSYIRVPTVLKQRSPARYAFIHKHMPLWKKLLKKPAPAGRTP